MTRVDLHTRSSDTLQGEARDWLRRLTSGAATAADGEAFEAWRGRSPVHRQAFAEAALLWHTLDEATRDALRRNPALASGTQPSGFRPGRRAFIAGGGAVAAALAGVAVFNPPLGLWASAAELVADYRTRTGERRQIETTESVSVELNTRTSIDLRPGGIGPTRITLVAGEATITAPEGAGGHVLAVAGNGGVEARRAAFNMRNDGGKVSVACLLGEIRVWCRDESVTLNARQRIAYGDAGFGGPAPVDPEAVTAWRRGLLIFSEAPLVEVIEEVNRYRPGRIVLMDEQLGRRLVVATFRLDRIDDVVTFVTDVLKVPVRALPGGVVLLG